MIHLQQVSLQLGKKQLLDNIDWLIHAGQKVGLVGANGTGKSTLFKILLGELQGDHGEVNIPKYLKWSHLKQEVPHSEESALDYCLAGDKELQDLNAQLAQAEATEDHSALGEIYAHLTTIDAFSAPSRAAIILVGLGFPHNELNNPVNSFSGGWRMRLNLAQVLMARADVILLDEPTNHLDLEAIIWLEEWLSESNATVIVISHERDFLNKVCTHITHLKNQQLKMYTGNYSAFEKEYAMQLTLQHAAHAKQQARIAHLQKFVDRFRAKASKAKQAQSRVKMIERMETVAAVQVENPFRFEFKPTAPAGNPMLALKNANIGYDQAVILEHIRYSISDGERIALLGPNGAGKSTFIKALAGELGLMHGDRETTTKLKIGYFAQHQLEQLHMDESPLQHLQQLDKHASESETRKYLAQFNFRGDTVFDAITSFSGGEKARLALALLIWQAPNLLLLDEPTNHLDIHMRDALSMALQDYEGALVVISHDGYLLKSIVDQLWLVTDKHVEKFDGDLDDYRRWVVQQQREVAAREGSTVMTEKKKPNNSFKIKKLERELSKLAKQLEKIDSQLQDPQLYQENDADKIAALNKKQHELQNKIEQVEEDLLKLL